MYNRPVREEDFRQPEYKSAKVEDYEFRQDGKIVRKDRWEVAVHTIRGLLDRSSRDFEISEVVDAVESMIARQEEMGIFPEQTDPPADGCVCRIRLQDGSVLNNASYIEAECAWLWKGLKYSCDVEAWMEKT